MNKKTTHFGFQTVDWDEKAGKVGAVFDSVASRYDRMNDILSFGIHRLWKHTTIALSHVRPGHIILDLAGGSGDLTHLFSKKIGDNGHVVLADINASMLAVGRNRLLDEGIYNNVTCVQTDAQSLPFSTNYFHIITMAFGLRNVTDKAAALASMFRVCRPGGKIMILEFSTPVLPGLKPLYDAYSFHILPTIGQWVTNDGESYRYLAESIRMHPPQEELKDMIEAAGFEDCRYHHFSGGIVALHIAYKY